MDNSPQDRILSHSPIQAGAHQLFQPMNEITNNYPGIQLNQEAIQKSGIPRQKGQPEWFRSKLSEIGKKVISNTNSQSAIRNTAQHSGLSLPERKGIPGAEHGGHLTKFNRHNGSSERIGMAGQQLMGIKPSQQSSSLALGIGQGLIHSQRNHNIGGSSSHLENKNQIKNYISNISGQNEPIKKRINLKNLKPESTKHIIDSRAQLQHNTSLSIENKRLPGDNQASPIGGLYKFQANKKYAGSQSRIPVFKGSSEDSSSIERERERSSSLSNYKGKIPRLKSNERLAVLPEMDSYNGGSGQVSTSTISTRGPAAQRQKRKHDSGVRMSLGNSMSKHLDNEGDNSRISQLQKQHSLNNFPKLTNHHNSSQVSIKAQNESIVNQIQKPTAGAIRQSQYRQPKRKIEKPILKRKETLPVAHPQPNSVSYRQSAKTRGIKHTVGCRNNIDNLFLAKKFGDDQLAELSYVRFQEAKKRLRNFVINTDMRGDDQEKKRLISFFSHRPFTFINLMKECFKARKAGGSKLGGDYQQGIASSESEIKKIFKLSTKNQSAENLPPEAVSARALDAIGRFRRENPGVDKSKKIFIVLGQYHDMREALRRKGWVENPIENFDNPHDYRVHAFHFLYTTKSRDAFKFQTAPFQQVNHFQGTKSLTTKVGLTHNMKNLVWNYDMDINEVFPQSFDLTDFSSEEFKDFVNEFKFGQLVACLKLALNMSPSLLQKNLERIIISIGFVERRIRLMSEKVFEPAQTIITPGTTNDLDLISDDVYYFVMDQKSKADFTRQPWYLKLAKQNELIKDISASNAKDRIAYILEQLRDAMGSYQFGLYGTKNAWIVKPGGKSRGRGIQIHSNKDNLINYIRGSLDKIWVTQKYIESPLIIKQKKFDIRQWVCVTSWEPSLEIWFYTENYLRFTSDNYDPNQLHNKFANLTNATVNKENRLDIFEDKEFSTKINLNEETEFRIEGNMWTNFQFDAFLQKLAKKGEFPNGVYQDKILPQLQKGVISSILATRNSIANTPRHSAHEVFGYDFMVDTSFNVWLIEVNSSPSMEYSSPITERMVREVLFNLCDIGLQQEEMMSLEASVGQEASFSPNQRIGKFQLIYKD